MWWLVIFLLVLFFSSRREGLDNPDDAAVQLQLNLRAMNDLSAKVTALSLVADKVAPMEKRLQECNAKLDTIAAMCVKCTT